jgi:hypothetical protein
MKSHHSFLCRMTVNILLIVEHYKVADVCSGVLLLIFIACSLLKFNLFMLSGNGRQFERFREGVGGARALRMRSARAVRSEAQGL